MTLHLSMERFGEVLPGICFVDSECISQLFR